MKALIIDDEQHCREVVRSFIENYYSEFEVIEEAFDVESGKEKINELSPHLVFLDIQLNDRTCFELLEEIDAIDFQIIFTTAYDNYAVKAFEVNALDYLMKPIMSERFAEAIKRVRSAVVPEPIDRKELLSNRRIFIKDGEKRFFIKLDKIYYIESLEHYTRLFFEEGKAIQRRSIRQWEKILDENVFFRINRKEIININYVYEVHKELGGKLKLKLNTGELLEVSKRQSVKFKNLNKF